jgi:hypothetical protein
MFAKRMACDLAWDYALYAEFFKVEKNLIYKS